VWRKICPQFAEDFHEFGVVGTVNVSEEMVSIGRSLALGVDVEGIFSCFSPIAEELHNEDLVAL
jgi:hypothetical protein